MDARQRLIRTRLKALGVACLAVVGLAACDDIDPPLDLEGTGALEGLVFFDAAEDGIFDPSDGDQALSGVRVAVQARGTGETVSGGSGSSGDDGRFRLNGLPLGTHDMVIDTSTVPEGVNICQNPLRVTVVLDQTRFQNVQGRPGCLITIAAAKELPLGEFAIVRGVVTSSPGQIESSFTYIQDETAGSKIFAGALEGQGIEVGDQIEIGAETGAFSGDFNFEGSVVLRSLVPDVGAPEPMVVTTAEISASGSDFTHPIQGAFIRVEGAQLLEAFGDSGNEQNSSIDDGSGATTIRIDDGVAPRGDLDNILTAGACYNINGFGANFNGAGQIFPRSLDDIEEVSCN